MAWAVAIMDDCGECDDLRIEVTVEEVGAAGAGLVAHLAPATASKPGDVTSEVCSRS